MTQDGIFTQPGPDGIFGRGGQPGDASSPPIDSDDTPLRDTLLVAYPSPGHMRVARAVRHTKTGKIVEFQEQYREPTPEEVQLLKEQGLKVGPGSMVLSGGGGGDALTAALVPPAPSTPPPAAPEQERGVLAVVKRQPWIRIGMGVAIGAAGFWAYGKYIAPMFDKRSASKERAAKAKAAEQADDEDDGDDGDDSSED